MYLLRLCCVNWDFPINTTIWLKRDKILIQRLLVLTPDSPVCVVHVCCNDLFLESYTIHVRENRMGSQEWIIQRH